MNDLIFRSDAINAIKARFGNVMVIEEATKALEGVPECMTVLEQHFTIPCQSNGMSTKATSRLLEKLRNGR